jgi:hypothetical protein
MRGRGIVLYILTAAHGLNVADIVFQLLMLLILLAIPILIISIFRSIRRNNNRLKILEKQVREQLQAEKNKEN